MATYLGGIAKSHFSQWGPVGVWEKWIIADLPMQSVVLPPEGHIKRERTLFCKHRTCRSVIALPGISLPFTDVQISFIQ